MALVFLGKTECEICGKILEEGDDIVALPPISDTRHPLWKYFDASFHKSCYDNWDRKEEAEQVIQAEQRE